MNHSPRRRWLLAAPLALLVSGCIPKPAAPASPPPLGPLASQTGGSSPLPTTFPPAPSSPVDSLGDGAPGSDSLGPLPGSGGGDRHDHAVLLVHGLGMSGIGMTAIQAYLSAQGVPNVETIDLPGGGITTTMEEMAGAVARQVATMRARGITKVDLVGHSMGGLVIREYAANHMVPGVQLATLITVATPNHGNGTIASMLELLGQRTAITQMSASSDFIARINRTPLPAGTRGYGLWTRSDDIVNPSESCILPVGESFVLDVGGRGAHVAMAIHPTSLAAIHRLLVGAPQGSV